MRRRRRSSSSTRAAPVFQNLQTGGLRQDPGEGTAAADLNAPTLTRRVCRPLRVPPTFPEFNTHPIAGLLLVYGSFAVAVCGNRQSTAAYLERCGTHLHGLSASIDHPIENLVLPAGNPCEVVWITRPRPFLSG